ncbi:hypothetical protein B1B_13476 [mine drainage metagenome]|uniref:DUF6036 domain-containing protein n=1 Tax=mine drainage metagenome TaxID=410659 RepID=T0ZJE8_9ZZZZ
MQFWNSETTDKSWAKLIELSKKHDFVLIGGWAFYLYSSLQKSRDIDLIASYESFSKLSSEYQVNKNMQLKKYEIKFDDFDIDIYVPFFSKLTVPPSDILEYYVTIVENIKVPTIEALLTLKLGAYKDRHDSLKGDKDSLDIVGLLSKVDCDVIKLAEIFNRYGLADYPSLLRTAILKFDKRLFPYLELNENSFSKLKKQLLAQVEILATKLK